jgi:hypothetical protein
MNMVKTVALERVNCQVRLPLLRRIRAIDCMKSIVPLFRQNTGRVNLGLVNWDSFQAGFRMLMRGDKFAGVTWEPWWHERKSEKRRNGQRRTIPERRLHDKAGYRIYSEGESVQPLRLVHERRTNWKRRDGSDRRKSASRENIVSFEVFIRELRNGALSDENARLLIRLWAGLTTREVYDSWIHNSTVAPFFKEPAWEEKENREKFTDYAVASFLDHVIQVRTLPLPVNCSRPEQSHICVRTFCRNLAVSR